MLYTQQMVQNNIRNQDGKRVFYLGEGDTLTPGARDYLQERRIEILPASQARPERYKLLGGGYLEEKPEHMTHLYGDVLVEKTHPRILFRGAIDTLEAELLLCQVFAQSPLREQLGEVLALARKILSCEVLEEPLKVDALCGLTQEQLRRHSHFPQQFYGQSHFMPECTDGEMLLRLNRVRCAAREAERYGVAAVPDRTDILQALNRMSSMLYILMIRLKAGRS